MNIIRTENSEACIGLCVEVFVREQGIPLESETDSFDLPGSGAFHFLLIEKGEPIGTFRCIPSGRDVLRFGRFCILKSKRGKHYGKLAMCYAEGFAKGKGFSEIEIHAQCRAVGFYESCGYTVVSDVFDEDGIPHQAMKKAIT